MAKGLLHIGFYNYVTEDSVIALLDYKIQAAKTLVKTAKVDRPRAVMDITKGRRALTLIVLTGDRYVISAISRQNLARRLLGTQISLEEEMQPKSGNTSFTNETVLDNNGEGTRS